MRCTQFYPDPETNRRFLNAINSYQADSKVVEDETTEQVFSRKDRKAYRQAVLGQRTAEAKPRHAGRKEKALGEKGRTKTKARGNSQGERI